MVTGAWRGSRRARRTALAAICAFAACALAACGSSDFANDPRPPSPILIGIKVDPERVSVSPDNFGAGVTTFTITNAANGPVKIQLSGPTTASSSLIKPGQPGSMKVDLVEGDYRASAVGVTNASEGKFTVGKQRPSSRDKLLLP
jgi:hypothetical protein